MGDVQNALVYWSYLAANRMCVIREDANCETPKA